MKSKIVDSNQDIHAGGRADQYWAKRHPKKAGRSASSPSEDYNFTNVDLEKIKATYSLKGFEFGNWVNNEDRVDYMQAVESALKHLSKIVHSKNIGMDAMVGIAFGARGRGAFAAAHYEPGHNMINLTKTMGDHSLAHEYFHAIDYNFGRYVDQNRNYSALTGGTSCAKELPDNECGQFRYWANKIVDYIMSTESFRRISPASEYWRRRTEVFARWGEQYCAHKSYCAFLTKTMPTYNTRPQYLTAEDFKPTITWGDKLCAAIGQYLNRQNTTLTPMKYHKEKPETPKGKPVTHRIRPTKRKTTKK